MAAIPPAQRTQVLVVGAGPVGLLAALRLRRRGVRVRVVEQQTEPQARTFPVVLHPQSLRILTDLGLSPALFWRGRPLQRLAIRAEHEPRALLELPTVTAAGAGALTLPRDVLRQALQNALRREGVAVEYSTRLAMLAQDEVSVWGRLEQHDPMHARIASSFDAEYVIGADGYESTVREAIGAQLVEHGSLTSFAFFDAKTPRSGREALLVLNETSQNSVYPLRDGMSRFSFQLTRSLDRPVDEPLLRELSNVRIPWYSGDIEQCSWCGVAEFRCALVDQFGSRRIWLAGEAAHLTGPLGVQSLNVGLDEADELGRGIADALHDQRAARFGVEYDAKRRRQWRELLGLEDRADPSARAPEWLRHVGRWRSCLPASGADLDDLLAQLRSTGAAPQTG